MYFNKLVIRAYKKGNSKNIDIDRIEEHNDSLDIDQGNNFTSGTIAPKTKNTRRNEITNLPLVVYGEIGKFLELGGDLMNFCLACGREISNVVRSMYLLKNEVYLRTAIVNGYASNVTYWMEANYEWKCFCENTPTTHTTHTVVVLCRQNPPPISIEKTSSGSKRIVVYEDCSKLIVKNQFNDLCYVNCFDASDVEPDEIMKEILREQRMRDITFYFLEDTYSVFTDPVQAISFDLSTVLKHMIERGYISPNDKFLDFGDRSESDDDCKRSLIEYATSTAFESNLGSSCFEYLLSLPILDCRVEFIGRYYLRTNVLLSVVGYANSVPAFPALHSIISDSKSPHRCLSALESIIAHPKAPDINYAQADGFTALHLACRVNSNIPYYEDLDVAILKLLLENGADPAVKFENAQGILVSTVEHLRETRMWDPDDLDQTNRKQEMILLLESYGTVTVERSVDQPLITAFFRKRRRLL